MQPVSGLRAGMMFRPESYVNGFLMAENSHSYNDRAEWGEDTHCFIVRDKTDGGYRSSKVKYWRRFHGLAMPQVCIGDIGAFGFVVKYTEKGEWRTFFDDGTSILYTMQAKGFTTSLPSGFVLQDI